MAKRSIKFKLGEIRISGIELEIEDDPEQATSAFVAMHDQLTGALQPALSKALIAGHAIDIPPAVDVRASAASIPQEARNGRENEEASAVASPAPKRKRRKRTKAEADPKELNDKPDAGRAKPRKSTGPMAILRDLVGKGYFKQKRLIGEIVQYSQTNLAWPLKTNEISTPLARLVREGILTRSRNAENQYEYVQS
jgi:hypothetical protein